MNIPEYDINNYRDRDTNNFIPIIKVSSKDLKNQLAKVGLGINDFFVWELSYDKKQLLCTVLRNKYSIQVEFNSINSSIFKVTENYLEKGIYSSLDEAKETCKKLVEKFIESIFIKRSYL